MVVMVLAPAVPAVAAVVVMVVMVMIITTAFGTADVSIPIPGCLTPLELDELQVVELSATAIWKNKILGRPTPSDDRPVAETTPDTAQRPLLEPAPAKRALASLRVSAKELAKEKPGPKYEGFWLAGLVSRASDSRLRLQMLQRQRAEGILYAKMEAGLIQMDGTWEQAAMARQHPVTCLYPIPGRPCLNRRSRKEEFALVPVWQQQAWHPEKAADEEDTYDASSLQLQEMTDTWDANAMSKAGHRVVV
ncbi:hypothetical protein AK812_SmicGene26733 [Symbiodinium microadriaticum]|uniref:Uncharacterized protein n=1 Tax=Symbiodinium microadriaticum TaxID=2951 RepID=A0A1Q9D8Q8_SYMMI|nr:hypothetical protein AK812_SmicGene26733 [Symbiodinium microadriaticum]